MQWHEFVFSNERKIRYQRHLAFWVTWWVYFSVVYFLYHEPRTGISPGNYTYANFNSLILLKSFLLVILQATGTYFFIYFLLPRYLIKKKWLKFTGGILLLAFLLFSVSYLMYTQVFSFVNSLFHIAAGKPEPTQLWSSISIGLLNTPKVIATAATIKLIKYWWLKQKEKEELEREKINAELQLLKAQVRPGFLFNALNNIYAYSLAGSPRASEMLLKLSDLLSYMLYECDKPLVPLKKEIEMMKEYMALEKIRQNDLLEMEVNVKGELNEKNIAPFLLLPFIENSFRLSGHITEQPWINMDIEAEGNSFSMKLTNGVEKEKQNSQEPHSNGLANVQKRLTLLYPEKHELKLSAEQEMLVVLLKIQLDENLPASVEKDYNIRNGDITQKQQDIYVDP